MISCKTQRYCNNGRDFFVDIHSHILPGIDDGARDWTMFDDMLETAENSGVGCIIATPHYISESYENTSEIVEKCIDELRSRRTAAVESEPDFNGVLIYPGAEIFIDPGVPQKLKSGIVPTLAKTSFALVELPCSFLPPHAGDFFYDLQISGFRPVLAHPERYSYLVDNEKYINELMNRGVFFQINSAAIIGINGKSVQNAALKLIKNGFCHYVASDSHSSGTRNFHTLKKAFDFLCTIYELDDISRFFCSNGWRLIDNKEPEFIMPRRKKKFFWTSFLKR